MALSMVFLTPLVAFCHPPPPATVESPVGLDASDVAMTPTDVNTTALADVAVEREPSDCLGWYVPSTRCREWLDAWNQKSPNSPRARALCIESGDPFGEYIPALEVIEQGALFRVRAKATWAKLQTQACEACQVVVARDIGISFLHDSAPNYQEAQRWMLVACELFVSRKEVGNMYLLADQIYPCERLRSIIDTSVSPGRADYINALFRHEELHRVICRETQYSLITDVRWWP